jgi:hypothetical protein
MLAVLTLACLVASSMAWVSSLSAASLPLLARQPTTRGPFRRGPLAASEGTAATGQAETTALTPVPGRLVRIACRLQPEGDFIPEPLIDGIVLHEDDPTVDLHFLLGRGNYLPGLHDLVATLQVGETATDVPLDAGWGERNDNLVATVALADSGLEAGHVKVGSQLYLASQNLPCTVTEVTDTTFTIDVGYPCLSNLLFRRLFLFVPHPLTNLHLLRRPIRPWPGLLTRRPSRSRAWKKGRL